MLRILAINGSLRTGSHNGALLRAAAALLPSGAELVELTGLADIPAYSEDDDASPPPPTVAALRGALASADAVLISTPEYNSSIPGQLKNALDWASRPFPDNALRGKPVAVVGASTGLFGAAWAQAEVRKVLGIVGADTLTHELPVGQAHTAFGDDGLLLEPDLREALQELLGVLAARAGAREASAV
jgi:chromate reductase